VPLSSNGHVFSPASRLRIETPSELLIAALPVQQKKYDLGISWLSAPKCMFSGKTTKGRNKKMEHDNLETERHLHFSPGTSRFESGCPCFPLTE